MPADRSSGSDLAPGHRDRRPADVQSLGDVGLAEMIDECEPGDLALADGQVVEQLAEQRRQVRKQVVGSIVA